MGATAVLDSLKRAPEVLRAYRATADWRSLTVAYLRLSNPYPLQVRFRNGHKITVSTRSDAATVWLVFFPPTYPLDPNDRRIIDCGANIGAFSLYAAQQLPLATILSIEASPSTFRTLTETIRENALDSRIKTMHVAVAGTCGYAYFDDRPELGSQFRALSKQGVPVPTVTLESIMEQAQWDTADLLKMDIEGAEYDALLNSPPHMLRRFRRISLEHHPDTRTRDLFAYLEGSGFHCTRRRDDPGGYGVSHWRLR